jgi:hypothetical protein
LNSGSPRNIAASIRQKLLNIATRNREDFSLILTVVERLLYRLSESSYRDHFVLKGAMRFQIWADAPHRPARDLDLLGRGDLRLGDSSPCFANCATFEYQRMASHSRQKRQVPRR